MVQTLQELKARIYFSLLTLALRFQSKNEVTFMFTIKMQEKTLVNWR